MKEINVASCDTYSLAVRLYAGQENGIHDNHLFKLEHWGDDKGSQIPSRMVCKLNNKYRYNSDSYRSLLTKTRSIIRLLGDF